MSPAEITTNLQGARSKAAAGRRFVSMHAWRTHMTKWTISRMTFAATGALMASIAGAEPASFIGRVEQAQGIAPRSAVTESTEAASDASPSTGEPASFVARLAQSQGIALSGAGAKRAEAPGETARTTASEPASFIARAQHSQLAFSTAAQIR